MSSTPDKEPISRGKFLEATLVALGLGGVAVVVSRARRAIAQPNLDNRVDLPFIPFDRQIFRIPEQTPTSVPFELRMNVESGVSAIDAQYVREGVEASRAFMQRHFNFNMDGVLTVNLRNDATTPHASYRVIEIGASQQEFASSQSMGKRNTAAHEAGHQLQYFLTDNFETGLWGDWFLQEGTAQYIADNGLTEGGYYPNNQKEACNVYTVVRIPDDRSLRQINSSNPSMPVWSLASLAIQDMIETYGDRSLATYWRLVRANGSENAFRAATGVSLDQFAAQFDAKRRQFTFPGTKYQYWANQDPCAGI